MGLNELKDMSRVIGETLFQKLAAIEAVDKELNSQCKASMHREKQLDRRAKRAR